MYSSSPLQINTRTAEKILRVATEEESSVCSQPLSSSPRSGLVEMLLDGLMCCSVSNIELTEDEYVPAEQNSIQKASPVRETSPSRRLRKASPIEEEPEYVVLKHHSLFKTTSNDTATTASMDELSIVNEEQSETTSIRTVYAWQEDDESMFSRGINNQAAMVIY